MSLPSPMAKRNISRALGRNRPIAEEAPLQTDTEPAMRAALKSRGMRTKASQLFEPKTEGGRL